MRYIHYFWNKFKQEPDIWFFYAFLLSFSFSIRKILFYFPIQGTFNEYTAIFVYISDIFLFCTILSWFIYLLCNSNIFLSMSILWITRLVHRLYGKIALELKFLFHSSSLVDPEIKNKGMMHSLENVPRLPRETKMFHMEHFSFLQSERTFVIIPLILVIWSLLSIFWSQNQSVAFFRSVKLFEYYLLYLYVIFRIVPCSPRDSKLFHPVKNVPHGTFNEASVEQSGILRGGTSENSSRWNSIFSIIIILSLFQSAIGILQFLSQKSLGLFWLGESHISPNLPSVAKTLFNGHILIRSYGLFPHPNIFGGFLLLSIILCMIYKNSNHRPLLLSQKIKFKGFNIILGRRNLDFLIFIQSLALLLTFSKSAIIGLAVAMLYIYASRLSGKTKLLKTCNVDSKCSMPAPLLSDVPRGTSESFTGWNNQNLYGVEHLTSLLSRTDRLNLPHSRNFRIIILTVLIAIMAIHLSWSNFNILVFKSLNERILYLDVSRGTILANPVLGVGVGQFVATMAKYAPKLETWQFQPVHNVFLLIWSELGIVGLGLFCYWIYKIFSLILNNRGMIDVDKAILHNKSYYLSNDRLLRYFKAILLGFLFIMLFDHYFWDIQQGSIMFWMILGFIAGIKRN
jgi:hypothetical protein